MTIDTRNNRFVLFVFSTLFVSIIVSCALLTNSQVEEVKKIAMASEKFATLPGALSESYGILLRNHRLLLISRNEFGILGTEGGVDTEAAKKAWDDMRFAYEVETNLLDAGKQMDAALSVLKTYSELLVILVSDEFSDALSDSAEKLGKKLDAVAKEYNNHFSEDKPLEKVGGIIAKVIRATGGVYLRKKQLSILRDTIELADPLIEDLMIEVEDIVINLFKPSFINYEKNYLEKEFKSVAINSKKIDVNTIAFVYKDLSRTRKSIALSEQIVSAAKIFRNAHKSLFENTRVRKDLRTAIKEIHALKNEIDKAKDVEKKINK